MSILFSNSDRIALVRELLRDTNTVTPYWVDQDVNYFLGEELTNAEAWIPRQSESQTFSFTSADRTVIVTFTGASSALITATLNGLPLDRRRFSDVRWLQEYEGRTGPAEIFGLSQYWAAAGNQNRNMELAVYPFDDQDIVVTNHIFSNQEPTTGGADHYPDLAVFEHYQICRKVAVNMGKLMGWSDADLSALKLVDNLFGDAAIGLRKRYEAPETNLLQDVRDAIARGGG